MRQIGRYKLIGLLGSGGMGQVFKATLGDDRVPFAIKIIRGPQAGSEEARIRFVREARAAGQLQHPNIVAVHDIDQDRGALFMVMEYLRGKPLANYIPGPPSLSLRSKFSIMAQSAEALGYAHSHGVVHRDIKPANIIILADKSVKVVDFGIAQMADVSNSLVRGAGTLPYMSPEQVSGQNLDGRSDIWSLGVTLFELLTGKLLYRSLPEIISAPIPALPRGFPLSNEITTVLTRALAKDRRMRYPTAQDLASDLRKLQAICERAGLAAKECAGAGMDDAARLAVKPAPVTAPLDRTLTLIPAERAATAAVPAGEPQPHLAPFEESTLPAGNYVLPNLNFSRPAAGALEATVGRFEWKDRKRAFREQRKSIWIVIVEDLAWRILRSAPLLSFIYFLPLALVLGSLVVLAWLSMTVSMVVCAGFEVSEQFPLCKGCRLRMRRTAYWTQLVKSREEVIFGYRDCMAALKHRLWEDAAKLLSIHGADCVAEYGSLFITPLRYRLSFFECRSCSHHAARLTTDEMIERQWEEQIKFEEAYWGGPATRPSMLSTLVAAPRACLGKLPELVRGLSNIAPLIACGAAALVLYLIWWLGSKITASTTLSIWK